MSAPARRLADPAPRPVPEDPIRPVRRGPSRSVPTAARPRTSVPPRRRRRARRGLHPTFLVFSAVVVTAVVSAAVSLSAMIVQASFRVGELEAQIVELAGREEVLAIDVAELSSPSRVARWADDRGMVMPTEVVTLTIPRGEAG